MLPCILIESQDENFLAEIFTSLLISDCNQIHFHNKYYQATVDVFTNDRKFSHANPTVVAHVVVASPESDVVGIFEKFPDSEIKVLVVPASLVTEIERWSETCVENFVEILSWQNENGQTPGDRLRQVLECHPWADHDIIKAPSECPEISFEEMLLELQRVKHLCETGNLSDTQRRELAAATALKFARLLADEEADEAALVECICCVV
jgi:hypothetical protein